MRRALLGLTLFLMCAPALAQNRRVYLRTSEGSSEQLKALEDTLAVGDEARAAGIVADLLIQAARLEVGDALVSTAPQHHQGLRALLVRRLFTLPPGVLTRVAALQERRAQISIRGEQPPTWAERLRRFPAAPSGGLAATVLWERAYEQGDLAQCWALHDLLAALHPERLETTAARARISSMASRAPAKPAPKAAAGTGLVQVANRSLLTRKEDSSSPRTHSPAFARLIGDRVCVSNGAQIAIYTLDGVEKTRIPVHANAAAKTPPPTTGFQARIAAWGNVALAPHVLEHWLTPGRGQASRGAAFNGTFYSLLAFDPARGRVLWWDGDAGPLLGEPEANERAAPGLREVGAKLASELRRSHMLAVVADAARIYVALTLKGEEPELAVMAFERGTGSEQEFLLRPAWSRISRLLAADRTSGSDAEDATSAEMSACLALDGRGRLVVTTDLAFAACLDTRTGDPLWTQQAAPEKGAGSFSHSLPRAGNPGAGYLPAEPAKFATGRDGAAMALFFTGDALVAARTTDGTELWRRVVRDGPAGRSWLRRRACRLSTVPNGVVAYGGVLEVLGADGSLRRRMSLERPIVGEGLLIGDQLIAPVVVTNRTKQQTIVLRNFSVGRQARAKGTLNFVLSTVREPVNLAPIPGGLVAASRSRVVFLRWVEER